MCKFYKKKKNNKQTKTKKLYQCSYRMNAGAPEWGADKRNKVI